jgi:hypothetical protein
MPELGGWAAKLGDVILTSCGTTFDQCPDGDALVLDGLTDTPDGVGGLPGVRTEDVVYAQRDGLRMFNDWYLNRIVTLTATIGPVSVEDCADGDCLTVREQVQQLIQAWKRTDELKELVLYPPCNTGPEGFGLGPFGSGPFGGEGTDRNLAGPFGIVGRPRLQPGSVKWLYRDQSIAQVVLRFESLDQKIFVLDACGTPGFERCVEVPPGATFGVVCEPLCSPICADEPASGSVDPTIIVVGGTEVVYPTLTLWPNLTKPIIENVTTLDYITYNGTITDNPVIINTEDMTATQNGVSVTHLLGGSLKFPLYPGEFELRLLTQSTADTGHMQACIRDTLVSI